MQTNFEAMGGIYHQEGGYLLPDIEVPESPQIGMWGQQRLQYLRTNERVLYTTMLITLFLPYPPWMQQNCTMKSSNGRWRLIPPSVCV